MADLANSHALREVAEVGHILYVNAALTEASGHLLPPRTQFIELTEPNKRSESLECLGGPVG